jgi:hypothetical protein
MILRLTADSPLPDGGAQPSEVAFSADTEAPFFDYARSLIEQVSGVRLVPGDAMRASAGVYYGNDEARPCTLRIPRVAAYTREDVPGLPRETGAENGHAFPFDVFAALRFWLADEGNEQAPAESFDEHGRLRPERAVQAERGLTEIPIVNAYLLHLRSWLARTTGVRVRSHLPVDKRCVVVLSHDVDSPIDPGSPSHAARVALANIRSGVKVTQSIAYAAGAAWRSAVSRARDPGARHALFADVVAAEEQRGFRSTFFFAATSRFSADGCRRDVGYDLTRAPLPEMIHALRARSAGIGLHIGYLAGADETRIAAERQRLERVAGTAVTISRHHYYHLTRPFWDSLEAHGRAGLTIDSSISFNDVPGYRLGVALPFRPWNPHRQTTVSTVQVPTVLMDSMLFARSGQTVDGALERVERLLANLKQFEGVAAFDWHEYTSFPASKRYRTWGDGYLAILDLLASDPQVAVLTYEEAARLGAR